ncbi:MAG TPA: helix-turn-helix transcriptional regulator [Firmicutes bacterium]|nr:helix-turn-helix transcriptional regulator [Bacillota bacterium]
MRYRKTEMARAIDLRERRKQAGISTEEMADILGCADSKHVSAIEIGKCAITITKAARAAYRLQAITVEIEGVGRVAVVPVKEKAKPIVTDLRPGEAAWIALEEYKEAVESLEQLQRTLIAHDRDRLIKLYEQIVCDPQHAAALLATSIDKIDPTVGVESRLNHARKLAAKGIDIDTVAA